MSVKFEVDATTGGRMRALALCLVGGVLLARQLPSALPKHAAYTCFESLYELLESVAVFGSPAQWMVALFGLCLYPALSRTGRAVENTGATGSVVPSTQESLRRGPGSHSIHVEHAHENGSQPRGAGFFKKLRRVLAEGRSQARQLCGREGTLRSAVSSFTRKRSFGSRSSKSEDVLSSRLSMDSVLRAAQQNAGGGGGPAGAVAAGGKRGGLLQRKPSGGAGSGAGVGARWRPSMSRITSGQHLADMAPSTSSLSSATAGKRLEILSYNGFQAVDCLSHEMTDPAFAGVRQVVTDTHLLQFGAMIGEASAELALSQAGSSGPVGPAPDSFFGPFDRPELYRQGWELVVEEHKPGLHYWNWRRHLRRGLYMYKSKTLYETATTAQILDFTYDMEFRRVWDESLAAQLPIPPPPQAAAGAAAAAPVMSLREADAKAAGGKSAFMYARTKFPPPMASREYTYARRCWAKPDDGGCYCISRICAHPSPPPAGGRAVRVTDFMSGYVVRSSKGVFDTASPAVEVVNVYFEDPCMPSGIVNMGIRRALWPMVQKAEAAFRDFVLTKVHGNLEQPPPERPVATDALGAALGPEVAQQAARAAAADADAASCMGALPRGVLLGRIWPLTSPYVLLYRGYMAAWRGGRGLLLSALSSCMSLWCNATGLGVAALGLARSGAQAVTTAAKAVLGVAVADGKRQGQAAVRLLSRAMWPWETLVARLGAVCARRGSAGAQAVNAAAAPSSASSVASSSTAGGPPSHPLPVSCQGAKPLSISSLASGKGSVGADAGAQSPRGSQRRGRGGLVRRCAVLAVKVVKVAGAGLLLGRAARTEAGYVAKPVAPPTRAGPYPQQQYSQQDQQQRQDSRRMPPLGGALRAAAPKQR